MLLLILLAACLHDSPAPPAGAERVDSASMSAHVVGPVTMLTSSDQFLKAGDAHISPDGKRVIFQAIETPDEGEPESDIYGMYLGDLVQDDAGRWAIERVQRLSPEGSANACGWFHPTDSRRVIFASTIEPPFSGDTPGSQQGTDRYRSAFPPEMRIVEARIDGAVPPSLRLLEGDEDAYQAECSISPDGRHLLYASRESGDGDIFVRDLETGERHQLLSTVGYDGDPLFSPDGRRICYRSDRNEDDRPQVFVSELVFNDAGTITGIKREVQLTNNNHVNGAPVWHSDGRHLVYTANDPDHRNREIFIIDADAGDPETGRPARYGTRHARLEASAPLGGPPALDAGSERMVWSSQGADGSSQLCIAPFPSDPDSLLVSSGDHDSSSAAE
ncbi:MAG: hypothetical protein MK116_08950 [Phycisphaerales bacterium]|nr:hypothetical protein [Phycisphaerales bacterium]